MAAALVWGLVYFALVFAFAFATGAARVLVLAPLVGPAAAVLCEVPILILASWIIARRLLRNRGFTLVQRAAMGATGFALTMVAEASLSAIMRGLTLEAWAMAVASPIGLVGLAATTVSNPPKPQPF